MDEVAVQAGWPALVRQPSAEGHVLARREFTATKANRLWLTDITEHPTGEGKRYLCAIKDVYSGRIVGYSIANRMELRLAVDVLSSALARRSGAGRRRWTTRQ